MNSDEPSYLGYTGTVCSYNLYAYSENDVVNKNDAVGYSWFSNAWDEVKKFTKKAKKTARTVIQKTSTTLKNAGTKIKENVVKVTKAITTKMDNTINNAVSVINGYVSKTKNHVEKFRFTVRSCINSAKTKMVNFCVDVWKTACEEVFSGKFFKETVWNKWIKEGFWETFCKEWVYETVIMGTIDKIQQFATSIIKNITFTQILTAFLILRDEHSIFKIPFKQSLSNLEKNRKGWADWINTEPKKEEEEGFICNQNADGYTKMNLGSETLDICGCEAIAIYNAMIRYGMRVQLADLIFWIERSGGVMLKGYFGTNPFAIGEVLNYMEVPYNSFYDLKIMEYSLKAGNTYIFSVWNEAGNPMEQVHTYMVTCDISPSDATKLELTRYNVTKLSDEESNPFYNFSDIIERTGAEFICGYLVG